MGLPLPPALRVRYGYHADRLDRSTILQGEPASRDSRMIYDARVWEYLIWLGEGCAPADPFAAQGESAWDTIGATLQAYGRHLRAAGVAPGVVDEVLAALKDFHRLDRYGGNHTGPEHEHWTRGRAYDRIREFPPDREKRDKRQRERTRIASAWAVERGEQTSKDSQFLHRFLDLTDDQCSVTTHGLAYIAKRMNLAPSTVCRRLSRLRAQGWVQVQHRWKVVDGHIEATSNAWRVVIPRHIRVELLTAEAEKARQTRASNNVGRPGRYTPPKSKTAADDQELSPWADPEDWAEGAARAAAERAAADQRAEDRRREHADAVAAEEARAAREEAQRERAAASPPVPDAGDGARRFAEIRAQVPAVDVRRRQADRAPP